MTTILRAEPIVSAKLQSLKDKALQLRQKGLAPKMSVILVGNNQASEIYVRRKAELCKQIGCDFELIHLDEDASEENFLREINRVNTDKTVTGCFVQLPVPPQLKHIDVTELIAPEKDVDGFGAASILDLYKGKDPFFIPCTPKGILTLLESQKVDLRGKRVAIVGRSLIVGKPLALLLKNRCATVTICHKLTRDIPFFTKNADIVVTAIGSPRFFGKEYFRNDQSQIVIDVGISKDKEGKVSGDVDFEEALPMVRAITPVPGGVGPLTVLSLMENLVAATERELARREKEEEQMKNERKL